MASGGSSGGSPVAPRAPDSPAASSSSSPPSAAPGALLSSPHSTAPEFFRGAVAAATNIIVTFPVQKLISRQAYEGLTLTQSARTLQADGLAHLYRGLGPPLLQKASSMGIMFGAYDWYFHALTRWVTGVREERAATDVPQGETSWALRGAAALLAGSTEGLLTPLERMQTILQHRHFNEHYANTLDVARKLAPYGLREYYRGLSAILLRNGPSSALFFIWRQPLAAALPGGGAAGGGAHEAAGQLRARQEEAGEAVRWASAEGQRRGTLEGGEGTLRRGAPEAAGGTQRRGAPEGSQGAPARHPSAGDIARSFGSGALLGAAISTIFYPINVAKGLMQLQIGGPHLGVAATLAAAARERSLYHGVAGNAARSMLSWGLINGVYTWLGPAPR